jgi:hypothetical protein
MTARLFALAGLLLFPAHALAQAVPAKEAVPVASDDVWYIFLAGAVLLVFSAVGIFLVMRRAEGKREE